MKKHISRRRFLAAAATAAAAPLVLPSAARGANDRIGIGWIGCGRRMTGLTRDINPDHAYTAAYADVHRGRLEAFKRRTPDAAIYGDYRELLEDPNVDAVIISTPDHWHALQALHAFQARKDAYIEKPLTLTVREGRLMADAAKKYGCIVQTGSQQRSMEACRFACELIRNGRIGAVSRVHAANYPSPWECTLPEQPLPEGLDWDSWCGPAECRPYHEHLYLPRAGGKRDEQDRPLGWISFRPYSGGEMTGWGSHGLDMIQWALGTDHTGPVEVWPEEPGLTGKIAFRYASGVEVLLDGAGPDGGGRFIGDEGGLLLDRGRYQPTAPEIAEDLPDGALRLYKSDDHMQDWLDCIRNRAQPVANCETGHRTATLCHLGNIVRWLQRPLRWDPEAERFHDDEEANALLDRPMREPYRLPEA